ncbi:MAG: phosphotransferase family protein [Clostridia bacterium]
MDEISRLSDQQKQHPLMKPDMIPPMLKEVTGPIRHLAFPRQGCTSEVGIVESERGRFIVKRTQGTRFCSWLRREVDVLKSLVGSQLPIPQVLCFLEQEDGLLQSWALLEYCEGKTIREALEQEHHRQKRDDLLAAFGAVLAKLHATPCPPELNFSETGWLDHMLVLAEHHLKQYKVDGDEALLRQLHVNRPRPITNTLIHGDFTVDNVLVKNGEISAIIDWSGGAWGDPRYDLALAIRPKRNLFETSEDRDAFFAGYGCKMISEEEYEYFAEGLYEFF